MRMSKEQQPLLRTATAGLALVVSMTTEAGMFDGFIRDIQKQGEQIIEDVVTGDGTGAAGQSDSPSPSQNTGQPVISSSAGSSAVRDSNNYFQGALPTLVAIKYAPDLVESEKNVRDAASMYKEWRDIRNNEFQSRRRVPEFRQRLLADAQNLPDILYVGRAVRLGEYDFKRKGFVIKTTPQTKDLFMDREWKFFLPVSQDRAEQLKYKRGSDSVMVEMEFQVVGIWRNPRLQDNLRAAKPLGKIRKVRVFGEWKHSGLTSQTNWRRELSDLLYQGGPQVLVANRKFSRAMAEQRYQQPGSGQAAPAKATAPTPSASKSESGNSMTISF